MNRLNGKFLVLPFDVDASDSDAVSAISNLCVRKNVLKEFVWIVSKLLRFILN